MHLVTISFPILLKISDPVKAVQVLQDHAARTVAMGPHHSSFMTSQALHPCSYDHVWQNIYSNTDLYQVGQEQMVCSPRPPLAPSVTFRNSPSLSKLYYLCRLIAVIRKRDIQLCAVHLHSTCYRLPQFHALKAASPVLTRAEHPADGPFCVLLVGLHRSRGC